MNTTEQGNAFRDTVAQTLRAAGFRATETEVQIGYKNADVAGIWSRDEIAGEQRFAFEAKAYPKGLPLGQCTQFTSDYGPLVASGQVDQAWLISQGAITPEGRKAAEILRGLRALTFAELQRRLLLLDPYLRDLVESYQRSRLGDYYIAPETPDHEDLANHVERWMAGQDAPPLFVLGPYGKGKSTFATHLAATMAERALLDPSARVPILLKLGEIADEQSLEGLLGKVFASQNRVPGYHFEIFRALNRNGRFLIIYDGFDEMKHGLTPGKFQNVLGELMKIDEGDARILVLGRDTAFHDDVEFRAVIQGVSTTPAGQQLRTPGRRAYRHVEIRGFTSEEARLYVQRYFPIRAEQVQGAGCNPDWVSQRVVELISGRFDQLLERPVHALMLCEIAVHPDKLRPNMTVYELFDAFIHHLLLREVDKRGRDKDFSIEVRRRFNASLAWWLWERGAASTTTLGDIPQSLCDEAVRGVRHSLPPDEMRRELIQGCLVEKGRQTIYFHRSIQEFLAAEHLIETDLLQRGPRSGGWLEVVTSAVTPEVIEFVVAGATINQERRDRAIGWIDNLATTRAYRVSLPGFDLFIQLARALDLGLPALPDSPWLIWLAFFLRSGGRDFAHRGRNTFNTLADLLIAARSAPRENQAAIIYALARTLFHQHPGENAGAVLACCAQLPIGRLEQAVEQAAVKRSERQLIRYDEDFLLWSLLRAWKVGPSEDDGILTVTVDLSRLHHDVLGMMPDGFDDDNEPGTREISFPVQALYVALAGRQPPVANRAIEAIRPFFNDAKLRKLIAPIEVVHVAAAPTADAPRQPRVPKPTLRFRNR